MLKARLAENRRNGLYVKSGGEYGTWTIQDQACNGILFAAQFCEHHRDSKLSWRALPAIAVYNGLLYLMHIDIEWLATRDSAGKYATSQHEWCCAQYQRTACLDPAV